MQGLRQRRNCVVVAPERTRDVISKELEREGGKRFFAAQLVFYGGQKSPEAMIEFLRGIFQQAHAAGKAIHLVGDMSWAQDRRMGFDGLMEFEAGLDRIAREFRADVLCQYDVSRFSSKQLLRALKSHPDTGRYPLMLGVPG
jgi:hypothetical protein